MLLREINILFAVFLGIFVRNSWSSSLNFDGPQPLVDTSTGLIVGKYIETLDNFIATFQGIPYAKPPVNERRFQKAEPIDRWEDVLYVKEKPSSCMQYSSRSFPWVPTAALKKSEDCLYLNIWTPTVYNHEGKLPVMVWIHGGGYYSGSSSMDIYDGTTLASLGRIVVVSINYRLGVFGFLNGGIKEAPGNVGLHDQFLALKWIHNNIKAFNGDPNKITLFGESAGAISISLLMVSPMTRGLFHAAIVQSGSAYHPHLIDNFSVSTYKADRFSEIFGCSNKTTNLKSNPADVINCLKKISSLDLAQTEDIFTSKFPYYFAPFYGQSCDNCNEIVPESPVKMIDTLKYHKVPTFVSVVNDEGTIFLSYLMPDIFSVERETELNLIQAKHIIQGLFSAAPDVSPDRVFDFYFKGIPENNSKAIVKAIASAFGDYAFTCPSIIFAEKTEAVVYLMTHRSFNDLSAAWTGVPHFTDVSYVFGKPIVDINKFNTDDRKLSNEIIRKWSFFARNGYLSTEENGKAMQQFQSTSPLVYELSLSKSESPKTFSKLENCEFWKPFYQN